MSFRTRVVVLVAAAVAAAIVAAAALVYVTMRNELYGNLDDRLKTQAPRAFFVSARRALGVTDGRFTMKVLRRDGDVSFGAVERARPPGGSDSADGPIRRTQIVVPGALGASDTVAQLLTPEGDVLGAVDGRTLLPTTARMRAVAAGEADAFFSDASVNGVDVRMLTVAAPDGSALTVAEPREEVDGALRRLLAILLGVSGSGVAVAAGLGVLVSRRVLKPVERLTGATEHVAATQDLSRRIDVSGNDELARMARSFNTMLAALDGARAAQRQLVADASHELRTPLTAVRTSIEALAGAPDLPAAERARVLAAAQVQLEDLSTLIGDLVDLARPAAPAEELEAVRLDLLVSEAVQRARRHAPGADFRLDVEESLVQAVPGRLHRAVGNLLDNAVKHGGADGVVEVCVRGGEVSVRDHGPGIAAEDLPHVFDRFYRSRRARGLPGAGLGLAIVRQVAEAHGGVVRAQTVAGGGARLVLSLPS
ncbi:HAMP domain-containing sensor histidine kinase [Conexibacter stalactiti]|uniref:histidine kinase n=1 Tax=Conexibacter stalactiti TaxID=1940611 RepID=A0ABU4HZT2_9ACTN|nr:HAMP domain-containing sensor histidine kinase [Conexibacter stalactiti]MDW5598846.1 HAMP domain-containing sensor histidine kinase [Conexibacter stalactiti]MEC5039488.1 HAMP domain-containing sensor histidine kinase [Conexibacter stalactiti]